MSNIRTTITSQSGDFNFFVIAAKTLAIYAFGAGLVLLADPSAAVAGCALDAVVTSANPANNPAPQAQGKPHAALAKNPAVA